MCWRPVDNLNLLSYYKVVNLTRDSSIVDVQKTIERILKLKGQVRVADAIKATGFSRAYIHRFLRDMQDKGQIVLIGKANQARYIPATREAWQKAKTEQRKYHRLLRNEGLSEHLVLDDVKRSTGIFRQLPDNVVRIVDYGFTEMLNNAIEHSQSAVITVRMHRQSDSIAFTVMDRGIGIFRNIMQKRGLQSELEAIQDLLKGKQTTAPERHSGEGIFFTSRVADLLVIKGSRKKLIFDNRIEDVFLRDIQPLVGTTVEFRIASHSSRNLESVFKQHAVETYEFGKTTITVHLYRTGTGYVSRSQARRILSGLEKFATITLDFKGIDSVGQGFADEVFRVWRSHHPQTSIEVQNAGENVQFMINHVLGK